MTRNEMRDWIGGAMKQKGFWDDGTGQVDGTLFRLSLVQTELCEAMQEVKRHWGRADTYIGSQFIGEEGLRDKVAEELADAAIRVFDCAAFAGLSLDDHRTLYDPLFGIGPNERVGITIRCGKITALIGDAFSYAESPVEDALDELPEQDRHIIGEFLYTAISHLESLCRDIGRDLYAAIEKKMAENMGRPDRYGTPDEGKR